VRASGELDVGLSSERPAATPLVGRAPTRRDMPKVRRPSDCAPYQIASDLISKSHGQAANRLNLRKPY
jgi:hypothetical protein